jgi:hypothetical protein
MYKAIHIVALVLIELLISSCTNEASDPVLTWDGEGVYIHVVLTRIRHTETGEMLHGDLRVVGKRGPLISADLRCIAVSAGNVSSKKVYVSSLIDYSPVYSADSNGAVTVSVYWSTTGLRQSDTLQSLKSAKLVVDRVSNQPCFYLGNLQELSLLATSPRVQ